MKGRIPVVQAAKEMHAGLVQTLGVGAHIPRKKAERYIMETTGVLFRQSIHDYLRAWETLDLIEPDVWKGPEGEIVLRGVSQEYEPLFPRTA